MSRKNYLIIPIFIPFGGCQQRCVFCDQKGITGKASLPAASSVAATVEAYLSTWKGRGRVEVAFYGGTFTGLPEEVQQRYLEAAYKYVRSGAAASIRVSTRPDYVSNDNAGMLMAYGVDTVELGVQSMSDEVLRLSGRGHGAGATVEAVAILKSMGIKTGVQIMPGLPGETAETVSATVAKVIALAPAFARIYPAVVLKDTAMHAMYLAGAYRPWTTGDMAEVCAAALSRFREAGIPVIRVGLQATDELAARLVAGPYHPSFRQLVERRAAEKALSSVFFA